jgi:hypothetical protein
MRKHCGFLSILGLTAMMGLMASQAHAETMTLTVYLGSGTGGTQIYQVTGGANSVTADTSDAAGSLNDALSTNGFGAYHFSTLGGSSDFTVNPTTSQNILVSGGLTVTPGGAGEGQEFTVYVTEDGFTQPPTRTKLDDTAGAIYDSGTTGSVANTGTYTDSTPTTVSLPTVAGGLTLTTSGTLADSTALSSLTANPYSLSSQTVIALSSSSSVPGTNTITNAVAVSGTAVIPEPASLVMMLTGIPLPLVVLGILRRRRAAA